MPLSARQVIQQTQITKDNKEEGHENFDNTQKKVFQDNEFIKLLSQDYINQQANTYFINTSENEIGTKVPGDNGEIYLNVQIPLSQIHTLFNIIPEFPLKLLNNPLKVFMTMQNVFPSSVVEWSDWHLYLFMYRDDKLYNRLKKEQSNWTYQKYDVMPFNVNTNGD